MRKNLFFIFLFTLGLVFFTNAQNLEGAYQATGVFFHPTSSRYLNATKSISKISENKYQVNIGDLGSIGYAFQFDIDSNNNLVNWTAVPPTPAYPSSGFMTMDNPGGFGFYPTGTFEFVHSTYNNRYDAATKTFYMHYGYQAGGTSEFNYQRQIYEKYVWIPQPHISSISPLTGTYGTVITVTGTDFAGTIPTLGSQYPNLVDSFSVLSDTVMKIWVGYAPQSVNVRVFAGADSSAEMFAYTPTLVNSNSGWNYLGTAGFSGSRGKNVNMALTKSNVPHVVFVDSTNRTIVMKYEGGDWSQVGNFVSSGASSLPNIKIGSDNLPVVCYVDSMNGNNISVKKFDGSNWVLMGAAGFAPYNSVSTISISLDGGNKPSVLSSVLSNGTRNLTVYKFNGNVWMNLGLVASGVNDFATMDVDKISNTPYVVFTEGDNQARVKKLIDTMWFNVANTPFTNALRGVYYPTIKIDKFGTPYVVVQYDDNHERMSIFRLQEWGVWSSDMSDRFTKSHSYQPSLTFDKNGIPVLAFTDGSYSNTGTVMSFSADSGYWKLIGGRGFQPGVNEINTLQADTLNNFYIAFSDRNNGNRVSVMKFGNNVPPPVVITQNLEGTYQSTGYFFHPSAPRYMNLTKSLIKISDNKYQIGLGDLGSQGFSFQFDVDANNNLVNWVAAGTAPASPASGFMTMDNPGGFGFYPGVTSGFVHNIYNNRYDPATKTFYLHYGYQIGTGNGESTYQRQVYEKLVRIPQPHITSISPLSGTYGTVITVTGTELTGVVPTLGSQYPNLVDSFSVLSDSVMKIWVGYAPQSVNVRVFAGADSSADMFAYTPTLVNSNSGWNYLGSAGFSGSRGKNVNMALNSSNVPYVVYVDSMNRTMVMKYEGSNWMQVGGIVSDGSSSVPNIKIGSDDLPIVCYLDSVNGNKITMKIFDGISWDYVGIPGFAPYNNFGTISMSLDGFNMPYVLSSESLPSGFRNIFVYHFNGNGWVNKGMVASNATDFSTLDVDKINNRVYVVFTGNAYQANVKMLMDTSWISVGNGPFTNAARGVYYPTIKVDKYGIPYVVLQYDDYHERMSIYSFEGGVWINNRSDRFTRSHSYSPSLTFDKYGLPVLAFTDGTYNNSGTVMTYSEDSGKIVYVGGRGFEAGINEIDALQADTLNNFYVAFSDRNNGNRVSVMKFGNNVPPPVVIAQNLEGTYQSTGYFFHPSAPRYMNLTKSLIKISDNKYQMGLGDLGSQGFSFQFDVDANNNLVNWVATGSAPAAPASGFMTMDNPGGFGFYPGVTSGFVHNIYNNRYDPATKTFYLHYGYQSGSTGEFSYQRQIYEKLVRIPQPHITSISPLSGSYGTVITVTGSEFTGTIPTLGSQYPSLVDSFSVISDSVMKIWVGYAPQNVNVRVFAGADSSVEMFAYTPTLVNNNSGWNYLGAAGFSGSRGKNVNMALTKSNVPHVVFVDSINRTTVMKYQGGNWMQVGGVVSDGSSSVPNIKIGSDNQPVVCYLDSLNGNKITVKKFDGSNWVLMGSAGFAPYNSFGTISMSLDGGNMPYVMSSDFVNNYRNISVFKFDGSSWINSGTVANGVSEFSTLDVDKLNNLVYVVYADNNYQANVKKLIDTSWMTVGYGSFTNAIRGIYYPTIKVDKFGRPYVVLQYDDYHERLSVYRLINGVWINDISDRFTRSHSYSPSLTFDKNGLPLLAFTEGTYNNSGTVMIYSQDSGKIVYVGGRGFEAGINEIDALQADTLNNFYVAFSDRNNGNRVSVMKFGNNQQNFNNVIHRNVFACTNFTLPWGDTVYQSGDYPKSYMSDNITDSVVVFHVNISYPSETFYEVSSCNSYMLPWDSMVSVSGYYSHTYPRPNLCDSTVKIWVNITQPQSVDFAVSACGSFLLPWGDTAYQSGLYTHSYSSTNGCNGLINYNITINYPTLNEFNIQSCNRFVLPWGDTANSSGVYSYSYQSNSGCDSVVRYNLLINILDTTKFYVENCDNYYLPWGEFVTESGLYSYVYSSSNNCDSVVTFKVIVNKSSQNDFSLSVCNSFILPWGDTVNQSGTYSRNYTTSKGCDSVVNYYLTFNYQLLNEFDIHSCGSYILPWGDTVFTSGVYSNSYEAINGCDSIMKFNVTISKVDTVKMFAEACDYYSFPWNETITESGVYSNTYINSNNCDSVVIYQVKINKSVTNELYDSGCESYILPWGDTIFESGTYSHLYQNYKGCDSTVMVHVTINVPDQAVIYNLSENDTLSCSSTSISLMASQGESFEWSFNLGSTNSIIVTSPGTYSVSVTDFNGCVSTAEITIAGSDLPSNPLVNDVNVNPLCGSGKDTLSSFAETGTTIDWYDAAVGGNRLKAGTTSGINKFITPVITETTTYYAEKRNISFNCVSGSRTEAVVKVASIPFSPEVLNTSRCGSGPVQLNAVPSIGETIDWYSASTGTQSAFKFGSTSLDTNVITSSRTFYAASRVLSTGCSSVRTAVTATYNALPTAVTTITSAARCGEGILTISAVAPTGTTLNWFADSMISENILGVSNSFTTPTLTYTTNYWVVSKSAAGCYATSMKKVTATINALPPAPVATGNVRCGLGTLILSSVAPTGCTVSWYNVSSGGTILSSSPSYTTASLSTTTTYYVESKSSITTGSCISPNRTEVIAIVNANPSAPLAVNASRCGAGSIQVGANPPSDNQTIDWYTASTGTTPAFKSSSLTLDTNVITASRLFYAASRDLNTGCISTLRTTVTATYNALPSAVTTVVNGARCGEGTLSLSATPPTGTVLKWYADSLITESSLFTGNTFTTPSLNSTTVYWVASMSTAGCYSTALKRVTAVINAVPELPTAIGNTRCGTGTLLLTATAPIGGSVAWYNVSSGGTSISTSSNYTTASISTTTTYYVESKTAALQGSCISAGRTEVIAIVNANPSAPLAVNASRCGAGSIQVGATPSDNQTIDWYAAATGTTPAFKIAALTLDTNVTTANRLFYAASRDLTTGCLSSVRTTVTATYNALPSAVTTVVNAARCGEGALNLSATAPTGSTLHWYADSLISENPLFIGNAYTTPSLSATTIYWVVSKSTAGCYATSLKRVTATINAVPSAPIATGNTRCGAGTLSLTAIAPIGGSVAWYNVSSGGTSLSVASNYTTATLTTSTTYYVESKTASSLGSCVSLNRTEVIATVNTNPASPLASNASRCGPGAIQVGAIPSDNQVIDWYAASTGTALPFKVGFSTIDTNVTTSNRVFYAAARDLTNGCSSPVRTTVTATYNAYPANLTTATNASKCNPDTATISATALSGMTIDWYADSTLNTLLQSGSTSGVNKFITPFINSSTNYWAVQRNVTSGCLSPVSKKVTVTINVTPDAPASSNKERCGSGTVVLTAVPPQGSSVAWFNVSTGGTSLSTTLNYTTPSLSSTTTYYVESRATGPCISVTRTPVIATVNSVPSAPTAVNASRCGPGSIQLMANPASTNDQTIDWYAAATGTVPAFKMNSLVLDTSITATKLYYAASRNIATGCLSATRTTVTATFNALPAAVTTVVNGARCGEGTLNLSATPQTGASIEWYPDSNRVGTLINTGNTFTTPLLTSTNLYWLVSKSTAGCYSASSKRITASINQIPSAPVANGNARCSTGTVLLTAVAPVGGTVGWYNVSSGGTSLSSLVSYTTPSLTTTTTYFAEAKTAAAAGSCISSTRTMVIALINDRPLPPTAINDARCGAGLVKPSGIPLSNQNQVIDWYAASTGTTAPFKTSALILDTIVSSTKTFYIASRNTSTGCVSNNRVAVLGIINSSAPTLASASITSTLVSDVCGARIYRYTAAAVSGANSYNWTLPNNGSYIDSGSNGNVVKVLYPSNQATVLTDSIKVNAVNACGTGPSRALKVNLTQCILPTGKIQTEEIKSTEEINASIYPNPTFNRFNLNVNSSSIEIVSVRILDVQGRLVRAIKIKPNQINEIGSEFTPGIYFFEIRQGHRIKTKKVIKY